jgi:hypothetical protein
MLLILQQVIIERNKRVGGPPCARPACAAPPPCPERPNPNETSFKDCRKRPPPGELEGRGILPVVNLEFRVPPAGWDTARRTKAHTQEGSPRREFGYQLSERQALVMARDDARRRMRCRASQTRDAFWFRAPTPRARDSLRGPQPPRAYQDQIARNLHRPRSPLASARRCGGGFCRLHAQGPGATLARRVPLWGGSEQS